MAAGGGAGRNGGGGSRGGGGGGGGVGVCLVLRRVFVSLISQDCFALASLVFVGGEAFSLGRDRVVIRWGKVV